MVTKEQIERYINFAILEAGNECCDDYFKEISDWIRKMPIKGEVDFRCSEGGKGGTPDFYLYGHKIAQKDGDGKGG
jgi:hypothetical protein